MFHILKYFIIIFTYYIICKYIFYTFAQASLKNKNPTSYVQHCDSQICGMSGKIERKR
jgi:hypothetical protein